MHSLDSNIWYCSRRIIHHDMRVSFFESFQFIAAASRRPTIFQMMKSWCKYCSNSTNSLLLSHRSLASLGSWWSEAGFQFLLAVVIIDNSSTDFKQSSKTCLLSKCYDWKYLMNCCKCRYTWASFEILATLQSEKYWPVTFRQSSDTATWIEVWAPSFKTTNYVKEKKKL